VSVDEAFAVALRAAQSADAAEVWVTAIVERIGLARCLRLIGEVNVALKLAWLVNVMVAFANKVTFAVPPYLDFVCDGVMIAQALDLVGTVAHVTGSTEVPFGFHEASEVAQALGSVDVGMCLQGSSNHVNNLR
jgi:hypothetical protein